MDRFKAMQTFVAIVDQGSLSAAAEQLDRSPAAVVRTLAALEQALGVRLLNRSTRHIALTDEGRDYLHHCRRILAEIEAVELQLDCRRATPTGKIAITAPVMFGRLHIAPLLNQWLRGNSGMSAELTLLDRVVDVIEEGFDLALRIGPVTDTSLAARPLGNTPFVLCASPELLNQQGLPEHPKELSNWPCVCFSPSGLNWTFEQGGKRWQQKVKPLISTNQIDAVLSAAREGLGIGRVLGYQAQADFEQGTLVPVLSEFQPEALPVQFVFPHNRLLSPRVRQFLDAVVEPLQQRLKPS